MRKALMCRPRSILFVFSMFMAWSAWAADPTAWITLASGAAGNVAVRFVNGDVQCASYDGRNCAFGMTSDQVQAATQQTLTPLSCGAMNARIWGVDGYSTPNHWCGTAYARYYAAWRSAAPANVQGLYSVNPNGDVQCMSTDGRNCLWGQTTLDPATVSVAIPLACGAMNLAEWGTTGYSDPTHWCYKIKTARAQYTVSTLAGGGTGQQDGTGALAKFNVPAGLAVDPTTGNVVVADASNHQIRKVTPAGVVTTLAGSGSSGAVDGTGSAASFRNPFGVAVDASGNAYVAETNVFNGEIREVTPNGVVTTLLTSGVSDGCTPGSAGGVLTRLALAPDPSGLEGSTILTVVDTLKHQIRPVSTVLGKCPKPSLVLGSGSLGSNDGPSNAAYGSDPVASFNTPTGVAADTRRNLYVVEYGDHQIRKINPQWTQVSTLAGSGSKGNADGIGTAASFNFATTYSTGATVGGNVAADAFGNLFVADTGNYAIRMITPAGLVTTVAGSGSSGTADGVGNAASFEAPLGIAVDRSNGNIYVGDVGSDAQNIRKLTPLLP